MAYVVFRVIVRREYFLRGQLTWMSSILQLLVFTGWMSYPYLFNPSEWALFWLLAGPTSLQQQIAGFIILFLGFLIAFGTMAWFGFRRAFGLENRGLIQTGPYQLTRNPQILGGYLIVLGVTLQWPSLHSIMWIFFYGVSCHWMILTEEEHLLVVFGDEFVSYCEQVPRYLLKIR
jgi:protein-S-isoprenylcysteine O-methyltransferase Ste14